MEYFKTVAGIPVHISDTLKGEKVLVLLHGYLETLYVWEEFSKLLSDSYRIVTIDIPGHGLSGALPVNTMANCADLINELLENLEINNAAILGHSMGGYISIEAIKRHPGRFSALIMMHSSPFADSEEKRAERLREVELVKQGKLNSITRLSVPKMFAPHNKLKMKTNIEEITELAEIHDNDGVIALIKGMMNRDDNADFLRSTSTPLLMIFGNHDNYISVEAAQKFISTMEKPDYYFLENSGHSGFIEEPLLTAELCKQFLEKALP